MLKHQASCTEGLNRFYREVSPKLRRRRARAARLLALFQADESLTLEALRDRHVMHRPRPQSLRAELEALGLLPSPDGLYLRARLQLAVNTLCLSPRRAPLRQVCRKLQPYRQQAALCALILLNVPPGAARASLIELCAGLPRLTPRVLFNELKRLELRPYAPGVYHVHDLADVAANRWKHAPGGPDLTADVAQLRRRLGY